MEAFRLICEETREEKKMRRSQQLAMGMIPDGYVTGDEFVKQCTEEISIWYKNHGLI
ncbi:hypothetical protein AGMMS49982_08650 [Bacteroidia bacterium]|nr:hypothetical protein AGMMS49982_08650 [Bacteroidia bacterium]